MNYLQAHTRLGAIHKELAVQTNPCTIVQLLDEATRCITVMSGIMELMHGEDIAELRAEQLEANRG